MTAAGAASSTPHTSEVGIRPPVVLGALLLLLLPAARGFSLPPPSSRAPPPRRLHGRIGRRPFLRPAPSPPSPLLLPPPPRSIARPTTRLRNLYDDWVGDLLSSSRSDHTYDDLVLPLDEESIEACLEELADSEYGKTMFGRHDVPASVGITGYIEFESLEGPEVVLTLAGKFWHRRETVLGKAAQYLNARIPEITSVRASSPSDLADFEEVIDEFTGEVLYVEDKRSPDFNGDRETMEYQGLDPDVRGPFVFGKGGGMMRPA